MKNTKASILLISGGDSRQRYNYVVVPLEAAGAKVEIHAGAGITWLISLARKAAQLARPTNGQTAVVFMGASRITPIAYLVVRATYRGCVMSRWGGSLQVRKDRMRSLQQRGMYLHSIALWSDIIAERLMLRCSQGFIAVTDRTCKRLQDEAGRNVPCFRLPQYRADLENHRRAPRVRMHQPSKLRLLTVTNLGYCEKYAGVLNLIEKICAYTFLKKNTIHFTIAGGGIYEKQLQEYILKCRLPASLKIEFAGFASDLETLYQGSDIFVYCSELDSLPNVLLEAMAHGLPLILNEYEDYREFFIEERHCLYYNRHDSKSFDNVLEKIEDDTDLYSRLSATNAKEFSKIFGLTALSQDAQKIIGGLNVNCKKALNNPEPNIL